MERVTMTVEQRELGKGPAHRMRVAGRVPGILYGRTVKPIAISADRRELERAVKTKAGMNVIIDLKVAGGDSGLALIRDYQADVFKRDFTHIDFQAISLQDKLEVEVPVVLDVGLLDGGRQRAQGLALLLVRAERAERLVERPGPGDAERALELAREQLVHGTPTPRPRR